MDPSHLQQRFRIVQLLWAALMGGVAVYALMVWALGSGLLGEPLFTGAPLDDTVFLALAGGSAALVFGGLIFRRARMPGKGGDPDTVLNAYQTHIVVASAIQEGGGLMGITGALLTGRPDAALGLGALAVFGMVLARPRRGEVDQLLR